MNPRSQARCINFPISLWHTNLFKGVTAPIGFPLRRFPSLLNIFDVWSGTTWSSTPTDLMKSLKLIGIENIWWCRSCGFHVTYRGCEINLNLNKHKTLMLHLQIRFDNWDSRWFWLGFQHQQCVNFRIIANGQQIVFGKCWVLSQRIFKALTVLRWCENHSHCFWIVNVKEVSRLRLDLDKFTQR